MTRAALYARVSSDRQEHEETIQSQLEELRARVQKDGLAHCLEFTDEGYGRDNLVRPGLDRLRDLVTQEELDRLYVQCPDRLASGAKLIILSRSKDERRIKPARGCLSSAYGLALHPANAQLCRYWRA